MASETEKYRSLTVPYCVGNGIDIGSGGDPVVPSAIQMELPEEAYGSYNNYRVPKSVIQWRSYRSVFDLPFRDRVLDYVYSCHLIEDYLDWNLILREWVRVIRPGGFLVIVVPDKGKWQEAVSKGQPPNDAHRHEASVGELSGFVETLGLEVIRDSLTGLNESDYSIVFIARKRSY